MWPTSLQHSPSLLVCLAHRPCLSASCTVSASCTAPACFLRAPPCLAPWCTASACLPGAPPLRVAFVHGPCLSASCTAPACLPACLTASCTALACLPRAHAGHCPLLHKRALPQCRLCLPVPNTRHAVCPPVPPLPPPTLQPTSSRTPLCPASVITPERRTPLSPASVVPCAPCSVRSTLAPFMHCRSSARLDSPETAHPTHRRRDNVLGMHDDTLPAFGAGGRFSSNRYKQACHGHAVSI